MAGTATVTVTTYDFCGPGSAREATGQSTYQLPAQIDLSDPRSDGTLVDGNPFSLYLQAGGIGSLGSLTVNSSLVLGGAGGPVVLAYWRITDDQGEIEGELVDNHMSEAASIPNAFYEAKLLVPCRPELGSLPPWPDPLATGSSLRGSLVPGNADLTIDGSTSGALADIELHFVSS